MYAQKSLPVHHREGFHLPFPLYRERCSPDRGSFSLITVPFPYLGV